LHIGLLLLQLILTAMQRSLLLKVLLNLRGQGMQLGGQFSLAGEVMALRRQLFQAAEVEALLALAFPVLLGLVQLLDRVLLALLPVMKFLEPGVRQCQLLELGLLGLELFLRVAQLLVQFGAGFRGQWGDAGGLVLQLLMGVFGVFGFVEGAAPKLGVERGVGRAFPTVQ